jgi:hypothetical protein
MKNFLGIVGLFIVFAVCGSAQAPSSTEKPVIYVIRKPTIVAFFVPVTESEIANDADANEALSDFQYYVGSVRDTLLNAGIEFHEADALSFKIRSGKKLRVFRTGKIGVGYYFIAPGKPPHIQEGVMTDQDLVEEARKYFGLSIPFPLSPDR